MKFYFLVIFILIGISATAQDPMHGAGNRFRGIKNAGQGNDSLARRNKFEDSVTITYRYLDTARVYKLDSSINDLTRYYPMPSDYNYLGNFGNAAESYLFSPRMKSGWDPGFHAYDIYKYTIEKARFFTATRPYSELNYLLGTRSEQFIELMHTQNIKPNWNVHFQYRLLNSPGIFQNQKSAHNSYLVTNWIQSKDKRYNNYIILAANKLQNTENGGILNNGYIDTADYSSRDFIPVRLGGGTRYSADFFNTSVATGTKYNDLNVLLRQQYDFGRKDSIVTDSTVVPLFFPRVRMEHTIQYSKYNFVFDDAKPDSAYYMKYYALPLPENMGPKGLSIGDAWREMTNDFSIYTFPDAHNTQQFIKVGAGVQNLNGSFDSLQKSYYNIFGHGEYRNRSKNQRWDMMATGKLYFAGMNAGDFEANANIQSLLGKKIGSLLLGFQNVNRTPSFITNNPISNFYLTSRKVDFKKENITHLYASIYQPLLKLGLSGHYYLINNYTYYTNFFEPYQYNTLFNFLQIGVNKVFETGKTKQWKWRTEVYFQQVVGKAPVNVPAIYTRNRLGYEGKLGFPKLNIAMGLEAKYRTNYFGNNYSPVLGQFFFQNQECVCYVLPNIAAYVNFRINSFKAFFRAENLNTFRKLDQNWGFTNNNFAAPQYPYPGLLIRLGVFWGFVN